MSAPATDDLSAYETPEYIAGMAQLERENAAAFAECVNGLSKELPATAIDKLRLAVWQCNTQARTQTGSGANKPRRRLHFVPATDLQDLAPPQWLIRDVLVADSMAVLSGREASGKSFVAVDWGLSVANGTPWLGRSALQGKVGYIAAEGVSSFWRRIEAWMAEHGGCADNLFVLGEAPQLVKSNQTIELIDAAREHGDLSLIIVDTLARTFVGGDENTALDMGVFVENVERLRRETHAAVVIVHHQTKNSGSPRGSSALAGAASTMLALDRSGDSLTLRCHKQKDAEEFNPIALRLETVVFGSGESSCVIRGGATLSNPSTDGLRKNERAALEILVDQFPQGAKASQWQKAAKDSAGLSNGSFYSARKSLLADDWVDRNGDLYVPTAKALQLLQNNSIGANGVPP
jgi:hypothetical protein